MRAALFAVLLLPITVGQAAPVVVDYSGAVRFVRDTAADYASVGARFQGSITYEATSTDLQSGDAVIGEYDAITAASFSIGGNSITFVDSSVDAATPYARIRLTDFDSFDSFLFSHDATLTGEADRFLSISIAIQRNSPQLVSDQLTDFDPVKFFNGPRPRGCLYECASLLFDVFDTSSGIQSGRVIGVIDSLQVTSVPLPAAAWLLLSGAGGMLAFARRRRAAA